MQVTSWLLLLIWLFPPCSPDGGGWGRYCKGFERCELEKHQLDLAENTNKKVFGNLWFRSEFSVCHQKALDMGLCHRDAAGTVITRCCFCLAPKENRAVGGSERAPSLCSVMMLFCLCCLHGWVP